jgi:hypothetical protein
VFEVSYNERAVQRSTTILGSALLGFAIAAVFYVLGAYLLRHETSPGPLDLVLSVANVILCPPVLLFVWCIDCEYGTSGGLLVNLILVGLLNGGLYATTAFAVSRRRERKKTQRLLPKQQSPE